MQIRLASDVDHMQEQLPGLLFRYSRHVIHYFNITPQEITSQSPNGNPKSNIAHRKLVLV